MWGMGMAIVIAMQGVHIQELTFECLCKSTRILSSHTHTHSLTHARTHSLAEVKNRFVQLWQFQGRANFGIGMLFLVGHLDHLVLDHCVDLVHFLCKTVINCGSLGNWCTFGSK